MTLKTIFKKPLDRPIEGVIKADDAASLRLEIEEYVLTNEVEKRLESFLDAYNNYEGANGVWISGFFGSGKSHLLKILAILIENRPIEGVSALELFLPKCGDNEILRSDLKRAVAIPSKSILFNIDQKADVISKTQIDALLAVFVKVFDDMCGYYGKQGHIAQFERDLDSRGCYEKFKSAYESTAGKPWQKGREQALLESKNIAIAYAKATNGDESSAMGILDKYRSDYRVSIEDFAEQVHTYIERQSPNFRLNFFVDEVGQYIADNVKLMTNLQTIAESLATKCRGRAWVIVTAQEDMGTIVGEMSKQQGNDFTKIQARFNNRMKLTSADVAEVIQKRLLMKTEKGVNLLSDIYHIQSNNFKTLFDFVDGSQSYRNFQDRDHFIHSYPFIPYQFALFQSAIQNLSLHNAFEGKHSSVGERSMLGVFQQVAIKVGDNEIGQLATFDLMFEGIRTALKSNIQRAIIHAENNLDNVFAIQLLKALFLIKYVKEFKATARNLCVLMLESFNQELLALKKRIEETLNLLERETYLQRNGDLYEYLTDEEKDVEQEIKNTDVELVDIAIELHAIVFDHIIKDKKIRYGKNHQDFDFSRKLDDRLYSREKELAINIISPFHEHAENEQMLLTNSMYKKDELFVVLPADDRLMRDLLMYKQTEKYIQQNVSMTQQEAVKRILNDKIYQNRERCAELKQHVQSLISKARFFIAGEEVEISSEEAQTRVQRGFHELITRSYPNLNMLRGITYTENDIVACLNKSQHSLSGNGVTSLAESEQELLAFIQSNNRRGVRTTLKNLLEKFEHKPYGWSFPATLCTLAKLCARGKIELRVDGNLLEDDELELALRNTHGHGNVVLEPQLEFTASQVRALKEFFQDFFDNPPPANEAKTLGRETGIAFQSLMQELKNLADDSSKYPFLQTLTPVIEKLKELNGKPYAWYLTELIPQEDILFDMKESIIDPVRKFMRGPLKDIFDNACQFVQIQKPNFTYIEGDEAQQIITCLEDQRCFKGNQMQQVKLLLETLQKKVSAQLEEEITKGKEKIVALKDRLCGMAEFGMLNKEQQEQITRAFNKFSADFERQDLIAVIRDELRRFEESDYRHLLSQMATWAQLTPPTHKQIREPGSPGITDTGENPSPTVKQEPRIEYVSSREVKVSFDKAWLADENDVDSYLQSMRKSLLKEISKGKRIQI
ncbi:TPA: BREX system P-loop protein BrxC [Legionella pneumophila]|uniref:BREX system P-loop protein BrxC n=1 Tax=Legionella pneumophila TaxID=446 RepID=UPI0007708110|nr:BREX system P-loop protein BrxC [Legionella pneumophila]MBN5928703.1 BREX system P-loop protein BrxC [Legionella pneumophila]MDO5158035.1 BREX system P-loop protein BrxC [Legionella pneumophila]MDO5161968.1 BREX system P-loop protein BrxC [Legionella pneumophila]MDO5164266.1 BREX system P-loop protein BrxC [Legionella pneumophila]MDO5169142.1 BREX system P-loop protein BrxC [Legionella pneumophila]